MRNDNRVDVVELRRRGLFNALAELYPTRDAARELLMRAQVPIAPMPAFGEPTLAGWWFVVFKRINDGLVVPGGPMAIVKEAIDDFPGHPVLQVAVGRMGPRRVMCLMASPTDAARIRLEAEYRELRRIAVESSRRLAVEQSLATRVDDIIPELLKHEADVVHFAGHGTADGRLAFEAHSGRAAPVAVTALGDVLKAVGPVECVVLNSCYAGSYAPAMLASAQYVIGATEPLPDSCALRFVSSFYRALAADQPRSVPEAFAVAQAGLRLGGGCDVRMVIEARS